MLNGAITAEWKKLLQKIVWYKVDRISININFEYLEFIDCAQGRQ